MRDVILIPQNDCPYHVMAGLFAGAAAFLCSDLMAAAYWIVHGLQGLFPIQNGGELAALYCFFLLFISAQGARIWSVDAARGGSSETWRAPSPSQR